ncbi:electron transport complex subunit RsxG [Thalassolituus sp.]|jgi:electron transport complex protein RnfG|uniref:electron transport complex subunit RsxG n=1 Tax=Thalassolituus sp. TaxID=2030822 RepID=UPI002A834EF5|nr:electron transport complex subunit RsxG [Thalassolituus sp.]|tara:strand:+ start:28026 stop:28694 length:669 start_codon:yes stop_codon:yes gene_type:complete
MISFDIAPYREHPWYQALLLGGACAVVSLLLVGGNAMTSQPIQDHLTADKLAMLAQVLPQSYYDNDPLAETIELHSDALIGPATLMLARKNGELSACALQLSTAGWGGVMQIIMAIKPNGELLGVRIISHKETPGLADKIEREKSDWITSFDGKSLTNVSEKGWAVKKDGGEFDQFTGATITPRSVVRGIHQGLLLFQQWLKNQPSATTHTTHNEQAVEVHS